MRVASFLLAASLLLAGCVTTPNLSAYPENVQTSQCFSGGYAFSMSLSIPSSYGRVLAMTQHEDTRSGLTSVCRLNEDDRFFYVYTGEVSGGDSGLCVSAQTQNAGHIISCVDPTLVRRALNAAEGTPSDQINFTQWVPFAG